MFLVVILNVGIDDRKKFVTYSKISWTDIYALSFFFFFFFSPIMFLLEFFLWIYCRSLSLSFFLVIWVILQSSGFTIFLFVFLKFSILCIKIIE